MNKVLFFILFILSSCNYLYKSSELVSNFENHLRLSFSLESQFFENSAFTDGEVIERPPGSWQNLISSEHYCLNYKVPISGREGILQLVDKGAENKCPALPTKKEIYSLSGVSKLKIRYATDNIQGKSVRNGIYGVSMSYSFDGSIRSLSITLPNKLRSREYIRSKLQKYASSGTYRQDKGVRLTEVNKQRFMDSLWFGDFNPKENIQVNFCERKNDKCEVVGSSNCGDCLYGWEYVVDYNCLGGSSKACSPVKCGEKGRPACPRGVIWSGRDMRELCFDDSPAGFCQDDLKVICGEDGVLICI